MKQNYVVLSLFLCLIVWSSCKNESVDSQETVAASETSISDIDDSNITLTCIDVTQSGDKVPHHDVYIQISENKVRVGEVLVCNTIDSTEYAYYGIPEEAISAVGGEVDEDGMIVYAMRQREKYIVVRQGLRGTGPDGAVKYQHRALVNFSPEALSPNPAHNKTELVGAYTYQGVDHSMILFLTIGHQDLNPILYEIKGELPPSDQLMRSIAQLNPIPVDAFNLNMTDLSFTSSIGPGKFEKKENNQVSVTLNDRLDPTGQPVVLNRINLEE